MSGGERGEAEQRVERILQSMAEAVSAGDVARWRALWHPDARELAPNTPPVDCQGLLHGARARFEEWTHDMTIRPDEVRVAGAWAFASGRLTLHSVSRRGRDAALLSGQFLAVLTDSGDGRWLLWRYCYNSSVPLAEDR